MGLPAAFTILTRGLLVILLGEAIYCTEFARLHRRGQLTGRLSVDVTADPPVDQRGTQTGCKLPSAP